jgi:hypothetical protein
MGGSVVSLDLLLQEASKKFTCGVIVPNHEVAERYTHRVDSLYISSVPAFNHFSALEYALSPWGILSLGKSVCRGIVGFFRFYKIVRNFKPDLIHLNSLTLLYHALYCRILSIPFVWHVRERVAAGRFGVRKLLLRFALERWSSACIFISEEELKLFGKTPITNSKVVYNFVNFESPMVERQARVSRQLKILVVGEFSEIKGARQISEAFMLLPDWAVLKIVGPVPNWDDLAEDVRDLFLSLRQLNRVHFVGIKDRVEIHLDWADVLVFWATVPHFPRPVYEAWLRGLPTIVSATAGQNIDISDSNAFVARNDSSQELLRLAKFVEGNYDEALRRAGRGQEVAGHKFSRRNFDLIEAIYIEVVGGG